MFLDEKKVFKLYILSHFIFFKFFLFLRWRPVHTKDDNYNDNDTEAQNCWNHFQIILFSSWWMIKTLTANQNPHDFKDLEHLKW